MRKSETSLRAFLFLLLLITLSSCAQVVSAPPRYPALTPPPATSTAEVIEHMQAIDAALPESDGLKWFNFLYLQTTQAVLGQIAEGGFEDPSWVTRLDVVFANYYFHALREAATAGPDAAPLAWRPLLKARTKANISRIQFALAGVNAHIERDLVFALLDMYRADDAAPDKASKKYADYNRMNEILGKVETQVKPLFIVGTPLERGGHVAALEDAMARHGLKITRQSAWRRSQEIWRLRKRPKLQQKALDALDHATELAGTALLAPVLPAGAEKASAGETPAAPDGRDAHPTEAEQRGGADAATDRSTDGLPLHPGF
jgi:hypothetical protein